MKVDVSLILSSKGLLRKEQIALVFETYHDLYMILKLNHLEDVIQSVNFHPGFSASQTEGRPRCDAMCVCVCVSNM